MTSDDDSAADSGSIELVERPGNQRPSEEVAEVDFSNTHPEGATARSSLSVAHYQQSLTVHEQSYAISPLPPAEELEKLEALHPGLTGTLFGLYEERVVAEREHRHSIQKADAEIVRTLAQKEVDNELTVRRMEHESSANSSKNALAAVLIISLAAIVLGEDGGAWVLGTVVIGLATAFLGGNVLQQRARQEERQERLQRRQAAPPAAPEDTPPQATTPPDSAALGAGDEVDSETPET